MFLKFRILSIFSFNSPALEIIPKLSFMDISNLEVLELVKEYDIVYGAIGFHPTELDDFDDFN